MSAVPKRKALVLAPFKNEGTGQNFSAGATVLIDAGAFDNYEAAGLVCAAPAAKSAAKPKSVRSSKKAAPAIPAPIAEPIAAKAPAAV